MVENYRTAAKKSGQRDVAWWARPVAPSVACRSVLKKYTFVPSCSSLRQVKLAWVLTSPRIDADPNLQTSRHKARRVPAAGAVFVRNGTKRGKEDDHNENYEFCAALHRNDLCRERVRAGHAEV